MLERRKLIKRFEDLTKLQISEHSRRMQENGIVIAKLQKKHHELEKQFEKIQMLENKFAGHCCEVKKLNHENQQAYIKHFDVGFEAFKNQSQDLINKYSSRIVDLEKQIYEKQLQIDALNLKLLELENKLSIEKQNIDRNHMAMDLQIKSHACKNYSENEQVNNRICNLKKQNEDQFKQIELSQKQNEIGIEKLSKKSYITEKTLEDIYNKIEKLLKMVEK